jgi:hypothetical protein
VFTDANGMLSFSTLCAHRPGFTDRNGKYIAKSAAKNISSLESHTMVPTDTILGRSTWLGTLTADAVVTLESLVV